MDVVEGFAQLFEGRNDAYGTDKGGCVRIEDAQSLSGGDDLRTSTWKGAVELHLNGRNPIGVYPMRQSVGVDDRWHVVDKRWLVKWGCVDFDIKSERHRSWDYEHEDDAHIAAVNLKSVLSALGVTAWIERTRSSGRHVWVFASQWVAAQTMRRALLVATSVAGVSSREVNPKQETLAEGQLGNYVRLPYPGGLLVTNEYAKTQVMMKVGYMANLSLQQFVVQAREKRTSPDVLESIAAKWREPDPQRSTPTYLEEALAYDGSLDGLLKDLNDYGHHVFVDGPTEAEDRSSALMRLARACERSGLTPTSTYKLLENADERWGKFSGRSDREKRLKDVINKVYTT